MSDQALSTPAVTAQTKRSYVDPRRALRTGALIAWAAFFGWLWVSDEISRYLGPRTYWVVPFGTLALGAAAVLHLFTLRGPSPQPRPSATELIGTTLLVAPLIAVLMVPSAELGSLASDRKSTSSGVSSAAAGLTPESAQLIEDPQFRDVAYAEESDRYAQATGVVEGTEVDLLGFVDEEGGGPAGTFVLTRFYVSCCAADAIPYSVAVDPGTADDEPPTDSWVRVRGSLEKREERLVVVAESLERVPEPDEPYLY
ncbi:MAG: TIGR03943 family protein [Actinomycetota bacterium]|nr:TIGR03943 family protein [Actinomycetota bacterium]